MAPRNKDVGTSSTFEDPTDHSSPYFVHPSDGSSSVTDSPVLDGSNYHSWARSMRRALGGKMKFEFVDGSISPVFDEFDPLFCAWNRCNILVHSLLVNSVSPSIAQFIVFMESACDVWVDLKERFAKSDLVRISELMQEIYSLQQDSKSVTTFYYELKILWEELEIYMPIPNCTCRVRCSCEFMRNARRNHTLLYAIHFLTGLNENFGMVKSQILLMDPLPSIKKIFSMVLQYERQCNVAPAIEDSALINAVDSKRFKGNNVSGKQSFSGSNSKGGIRVCTFCGRQNHTIETCYKKHGVPPHLQRNYNSSSANHAAREEDNYVFDSSSHVDNKSSAITITHEQYEKLMTLLQNSSLNQSSGTVHASNQVTYVSVGHSPLDKQGTSFINSLTKYNFTHNSWIIDSGASDHICCNLKWFHSYNEIAPMSIKLPTSHITTAKHSGTIKFSSIFIIHNVLYVPDFNFNLLSVSKASDSLNCIFSFNGSHCLIQD